MRRNKNGDYRPPVDMVSTAFAISVRANLAYWRQRIAALDDPAALELLPERENMFRAAEFGLGLPEAWREAAELILALHYFIEHHGEWRRWQRLVENARAQCAAEDTDMQLRLVSRAGQYYRQLRDWPASLAAHQEEERLAASCGDPLRLARMYQNYSVLYWRQRAYEQAAAYAERALAGFESADASQRQLGGAHTAIGLVHYGRGEYELAVAAHQRAVHCFRETPFVVFLARSLVNLALALEGAGLLEKSLASYLEAQEILAATDYMIEKARVELSLGTLYFNSGRLKEAEAAYLRAYSTELKRGGPLYFQGLATNNLGNVYLAQGRLEEAERILRRSIRIWELACAPLQEANSTGTLAQVLARQDRVAEAELCFEQAIRAIEHFTDDGWAQTILSEFRADAEVLAQKRNGAGIPER